MFDRLRRLAAVAVITAAGTGAASAAPYSNVVIFGDSLSDTGNVLSLTTAFAPPPFPSYPAAPGRFSNGPVWVEHLAAGLGLASAAAPANLLFTGSAVIPIGAPGGQNYAYGGARTGLGGSAGATTGLLGQVIAWNGSAFSSALTRAADPNALYVIAAGGNDMRDFRSGSLGVTPTQAAANVVNMMALLAQAGARNFLVGNLPDLGTTPEAVGLGLVPASQVATLAFNAALAAGLSILDVQFFGQTGIDLDIDLLDLFGFGNAIVADATTNGGALYGITNVTAPCLAPVQPGAYFLAGSVDINCAVSLYSDPLHPSAAAHRLLGMAALEALRVGQVPTPGTLVLVLAGMGLLLIRRART
jgi:outer membrane lipase/esterase